MIKFFRRIRKSLIQENNMGKYFKYAIGEILLVMIGILLALQVSNWNESMKSNKQKNQLVLDLEEELHNTSAALDSAIMTRELKSNTCRQCFTHLENKENLVSIDSIRDFLEIILAGAPFDLALPSYEEAKSTGKLSLLNSKAISVGYTNLMSMNEGYKLHRRVGMEMWYKGPGYEMRREVGGRNVLVDGNAKLPENLKLSDAEYYRFITKPTSYAALENDCSINDAANWYARRMNDQIKELIHMLEENK